MSGRQNPTPDFIRPVALGVTAFIFLIYITQIFTRYIGNDDYTSLYIAWQKSSDLILGNKLHTAYYLQANLLVPLFWWFHDSLMPLYIARFFTLVLLAGTCFTVYVLSKRIAGELAGWLAPIFVLTSLGMLHRGLDLRPDPLSTLIWVGVFAYILHHAKDLRRRHFFVLGMATGLAFFNREKAVLFGPIAYPVLFWFYCLNLRQHAWPKRILGFLREYLFSVLGFFVMAALYLGLIALTDDVKTYLDVTYAHYFGLGHYMGGVDSIRWSILAKAFEGEPVFWLLALAGIVWRASSWRQFGQRENTVAGALLALAVFSVAINPAYYAYNLMTLQTLLAPFCAFALSGALQYIAKQDFSWGMRRFMMVGGLAFVLLPRLPDLIYFASNDTMHHQRQLHRFIFEQLDEDEPVLALDGIGLYRPSVTNWRLTAIMTTKHYRQGTFNYRDEIRESKPSLVIGSYRIRWLLKSDKDALLQNYVWVTPFIGLLGCQMNEAGQRHFELHRAGPYRLESQIGVNVTINGEPWRAGEVRELAPGSYKMAASGKASLVRHYPPEAMALLSNPINRPYLVSPTIERIE